MKTLSYYFRVLLVELKRLLLSKLRYPLETITEFLFLLIFFALITLSKNVSGVEEADMIFLICIFFALPSLQGPYTLISGGGESKSSEYIFVLPIQVPALAFIKDLAVGIISLPQFTLVLFIMSKIFGFAGLKISLVLVMLSLRIGTLGIGLIFSGLALIVKRLGSLMNLFSILMISSTYIVEALGIKFIEKMFLYSSSLRYLSTKGESQGYLSGMISIAMVYFIFGTIIFKVLENRARKMGTLGR